MTTPTTTTGAADLPEALRSIQRFEVVDCIDDKHVPAVIPKPHGPWVRYEDHIAALAAGQATVAQQGMAYAALPNAPLPVFSKGPWVSKETGQDFSGAELDEAAFVAYREHASLGQAPAGAAPAAVAGPSRDLHPEKCPITGRPFFMTLDHPELGDVPTYGGPYDSYTIPAPEGKPTDPWHERELCSERYDHDAGWWVEGGEPIPLRIVHEDVLFKLQEDAEATASTTQPAPMESVKTDGIAYQTPVPAPAPAPATVTAPPPAPPPAPAPAPARNK